MQGVARHAEHKSKLPQPGGQAGTLALIKLPDQGRPETIVWGGSSQRRFRQPSRAKPLKNQSPPHTDHPLVLFDGVCNLCQRSVQFIIRHDQSARFRFASLQSAAAQRVLDECHYQNRELSSVLFVTGGHIAQKSHAILQIAKRLDGAWSLLYYLTFWIPTFIADRIYDFIGNHRYRWFGKKAVCWIPDDALRQRFVDD